MTDTPAEIISRSVAEELLQETPSGLALIICDQIISDERTKKKTLVGIFNNMNVEEFPAVHSEMVAFVSVSGGIGQYRATLKLTCDDLEEALFEIEGLVGFQNHLHVIEIAFKLRNVQFLQAGRHCFEFYCNEILILSRPFSVKKVESNP